MSNKDIVNKGLQARKDVRAAETRAAMYRDAAVIAQDARFYDQNRHRIERREWQTEREAMALQLGNQARKIQHLMDERDELNQRLLEVKQRQTIAGVVKAILTAMLIAAARDMGWIVTWLSTVLLCTIAAYMVHAVITLTRKK